MVCVHTPWRAWIDRAFSLLLKWRSTRTWCSPIDRSTKCEFRNTDCYYNWLECVCIIISYTLRRCANGVWRRTQHRHDHNGEPIRRVIYFDGSFRKIEIVNEIECTSRGKLFETFCIVRQAQPKRWLAHYELTHNHLLKLFGK